MYINIETIFSDSILILLLKMHFYAGILMIKHLSNKLYLIIAFFGGVILANLITTKFINLIPMEHKILTYKFFTDSKRYSIA